MLLLFGFIANLFIGIPIAAVILRASISLANRFLRGTDGAAQIQEDPVGETIEGVRRDDPFAAPSVILAEPDGMIPEPAFGQAYGICFLQSILGFFTNFAMTFFLASLGERSASWPVLIGGFIVTLLLNAGILVKLLPTSFRRVLLIMLCQMLIGIVVGAVIFGIVVILGLAM